jgi:hypothetical protein
MSAVFALVGALRQRQAVFGSGIAVPTSNNRTAPTDQEAACSAGRKNGISFPPAQASAKEMGVTARWIFGPPTVRALRKVGRIFAVHARSVR